MGHQNIPRTQKFSHPKTGHGITINIEQNMTSHVTSNGKQRHVGAKFATYMSEQEDATWSDKRILALLYQTMHH